VILDQELLIVTGKGGVGKTTVAASLAWAAASQGKRVLAVELDAKGDLDCALVGPSQSASRSTYTPTERRPRLWSMAMDPEESLKEYLRTFLKIPVITRIGVLSGMFDFVANAAPGVREIVTIGKFAYEVRERNYDLVIVDATSTGHVLGQLDAPQAINELVGAGLIRSQTGWMREILTDPKRTGVVAVTTAEEMPVIETIELVEQLRTRVQVHLAAVVVNRVLPEPLSRDDQVAFSALSKDPSAFDRLVGGDTLPWRQSVAFAIEQRRTREPHLSHLLASISETPIAFVPWLGSVEPGPTTTASVAELLGEELGWTP
jgi:anion-transporting  ArsA/GET3 family ATPase